MQPLIHCHVLPPLVMSSYICAVYEDEGPRCQNRKLKKINHAKCHGTARRLFLFLFLFLLYFIYLQFIFTPPLLNVTPVVFYQSYVNISRKFCNRHPVRCNLHIWMPYTKSFLSYQSSLGNGEITNARQLLVFEFF